MPGISGEQLYELVTDFDADMARRIVFLTGDAARSGVSEFLEATGNCLVDSPRIS